MSKMTVYHSEPQGLASNSGFEEENAARAALCAHNRLASVRAQPRPRKQGLGSTVR